MRPHILTGHSRAPGLLLDHVQPSGHLFDRLTPQDDLDTSLLSRSANAAAWFSQPIEAHPERALWFQLEAPDHAFGAVTSVRVHAGLMSLNLSVFSLAAAAVGSMHNLSSREHRLLATRMLTGSADYRRASRTTEAETMRRMEPGVATYHHPETRALLGVTFTRVNHLTAAEKHNFQIDGTPPLRWLPLDPYALLRVLEPVLRPVASANGLTVRDNTMHRPAFQAARAPYSGPNARISQEGLAFLTDPASIYARERAFDPALRPPRLTRKLEQTDRRTFPRTADYPTMICATERFEPDTQAAILAASRASPVTQEQARAALAFARQRIAAAATDTSPSPYTTPEGQTQLVRDALHYALHYASLYRPVHATLSPWETPVEFYPGTPTDLIPLT